MITLFVLGGEDTTKLAQEYNEYFPAIIVDSPYKAIEVLHDLGAWYVCRLVMDEKLDTYDRQHLASWLRDRMNNLPVYRLYHTNITKADRGKFYRYKVNYGLRVSLSMPISVPVLHYMFIYYDNKRIVDHVLPFQNKAQMSTSIVLYLYFNRCRKVPVPELTQAVYTYGGELGEDDILNPLTGLIHRLNGLYEAAYGYRPVKTMGYGFRRWVGAGV